MAVLIARAWALQIWFFFSLVLLKRNNIYNTYLRRITIKTLQTQRHILYININKYIYINICNMYSNDSLNFDIGTHDYNAFFRLSEVFAHNNKEEWLSDSDSRNSHICSTTSSSPGPSLASTSTGDGQKASSSKAKQAGRSKDTPAGQKPAQVVARRNARERRRVQAVNWAFARLRKVVPLEENKWVVPL